ncbi:MAG TPA: hypothetical protein VHI13_14975 [Candidatus Kapabacteria bacterium]|nr:hypothetical protein [Candidatus Kapabacteria bacterium]
MNRISGMAITGLVAIVIIAAGMYIVLKPSTAATMNQRPLRSFYTNNAYVDGLYNALDLNNPKAVFAYVYDCLEPEVTVYPSENYYYFQFTACGKVISGSIGLLAHKIDDGILQFGYADKPEERSRQKYFRMHGSSCTMSQNDSLWVKKINNFRYEVSYHDKRVIFNFYRDSVSAPKNAKLTADEEFVAPTFDESGLRFYLCFNKVKKHLFWILNEDGYVPETFAPAYPKSSVVIGDRTELAFYQDSVNNRKILVGARGENVLTNNWYDGPFDHMPDNYVKEGVVKVEDYLNEHYKFQGMQIDKYGHYVNNDNARVPVAPYIVYFNRDEFRFIDSCKAAHMPPNDFYARITTQEYNVPKGYYAGVYAK